MLTFGCQNPLPTGAICAGQLQLGIAAFMVLGGLLTLRIVIGETVRDVFDPR